MYLLLDWVVRAAVVEEPTICWDLLAGGDVVAVVHPRAGHEFHEFDASKIGRVVDIDAETLQVEIFGESSGPSNEIGVRPLAQSPQCGAFRQTGVTSTSDVHVIIEIATTVSSHVNVMIETNITVSSHVRVMIEIHITVSSHVRVMTEPNITISSHVRVMIEMRTTSTIAKGVVIDGTIPAMSRNPRP